MKQMRQIRNWVDHLSVKKKLVFYGYLTITPVLVVICLVLFFFNYRSGQQEKYASDYASVQTLAESMEIMQTDIRDFSTYISINNDIQNLLSRSDVTELNRNAKVWFDEAPMRIVQDMIALKGHIKTIAIYPENGLRPYLRGMDNSAYIPGTKDFHETEIYQKLMESSNGIVWMQIPKGTSELYQSSRTDKVVLCRKIVRPGAKKTLGFVVIGVGQDYFDNLCKNVVKNESESILVMDAGGSVLSQIGKIDPKLKKTLTGPLFVHQDFEKRDTHFSYGNYEVVCTQTSAEASIICKVVKRYDLQMQLWDIAYMPLVILAFFMLGLLPLLLIISNIVTKPLRKLNEAINDVSEGNFDQQVEVLTHDEVGEVAECFNRMVLAIKELIDKNYVITLQEKESELAALQAQINPHFLYNTLDSLYWQAMEQDNEEIAESILALSQLFRLVLSQGKREVTVGQETELVSRYLQIQQMRFSRRLQYEVTVEDAVKQEKIPKLILQPFVENAIVHGFENVSTCCKVTVTAAQRKNRMHFEITDTGIGMSQSQIDEIWEEEPDAYRKQRIGRYAIKNIRERLERRYKEDFILEIKSEVGKGTTVILELPCEEK
jgi:two-component system sensor histidine kinase YesM